MLASQRLITFISFNIHCNLDILMLSNPLRFYNRVGEVDNKFLGLPWTDLSIDTKRHMDEQDIKMLPPYESREERSEET